mgnify:CR=1 FL=1
MLVTLTSINLTAHNNTLHPMPDEGEVISIRCEMKKLLIAVLAIISLNVHAGFNCNVEITNVLVYGDGSVNVRHTGRNEYTYICKLNSEWKGVEVVTCAMWTSMLQNIQKNNAAAVFYYDGEGSCPNLPTYSNAPAPYYIGTK